MPEDTPRENLCPQCSKPLPAGSPRGLCPACLLKCGLEVNTAGYTDDVRAGKRWTPPAVEQLAPLFPELDILELIGRGGMGAVYKAREKQLDRLVALKILPPEIGREAAFAQRFAREAQAMARLSHPNIVTIHSFGQRGGTAFPGCEPGPGHEPGAQAGKPVPPVYFFIMEYVDGLSLRQLLDAGTVSPKEALAIVPQICDALQYAHDRGIVHRDIKPENILLNREGQVKIADFGLAKLVGSGMVRGAGVPPASGEAVSASQEQQARGQDARDTRGRDAHATENAASVTGVGERVMGTPQYMAPEQIERPREVDHRADIYSLGVVFYQMLTGELPKAAPGQQAGVFEPPSRKVLIDVRLDEVVLRALEREPARRYQQVSEVRTQVETIVATPSSTTGIPPAKENSHRQDARTTPPRKGVLAGIVAVCVTAIVVATYFAVLHQSSGIQLLVIGCIIPAAILGIVIAWAQRSMRLEPTQPTAEELASYEKRAPGWVIRCLKCGFTEPWGKYGVRLHAAGRKWTVGWCQRCHWLHCHVIEHGETHAQPVAATHRPQRIPVIGARDGKRALHWSGLLMWLIFAGVVLGVMGIAGAHWQAVAVIGLALAGVLAVGVLRAWAVPIDQLTPLESSPTRDDSSPRMSRLAIIGALWAPFALIAFVLFFVAHTSVFSGSRPPEPKVLQVLMAILLGGLGITAPFGTTICGSVAISQIRHSAGRLYGLGLAMFDNLLFPLLILNSLVAAACYFGLHEAFDYTQIIRYASGERGGTLQAVRYFSDGWVILLVLAIVIPLDKLIIRWAWRAAKQPVGSGSPETPRDIPSQPVLQSEPARQAVKAPAIGMIVAAGINLAVLFAVIAVLATLSNKSAAGGGDVRTVVGWWQVAFILVPGLIINCLILWGAIRMMQLRNRGLAITAAILALITAPGNIIGLPMGIWALVVLSRREVLDSFLAHKSRSRPGTSTRPAWHRWVAVVGTRAGRPMVNWPGVIVVASMLFGIMFATFSVVRWLMGGDLSMWAVLLPALLAICTLLPSIYLGLTGRISPERLVPVDGPSWPRWSGALCVAGLVWLVAWSVFLLTHGKDTVSIGLVKVLFGRLTVDVSVLHAVAQVGLALIGICALLISVVGWLRSGCRRSSVLALVALVVVFSQVALAAILHFSGKTAQTAVARPVPQTTQPTTGPASTGSWTGDFGTLPPEVTVYVIDKHRETYAAAKEKGLFANSKIYCVSDDLKLRGGGLITFENISDEPMAGEIPLAVFDSNDLVFEDVSVGKPKIRWVDRGADTKFGRYQVLWTPDKPLPLGAFHVFCWMSPRVESLRVVLGVPYDSPAGLRMRMSNFPGPQALEDFFLILPKDISISNPSSKWKSHKQIASFNVYHWQDEVRANTNHEVSVSLDAPLTPQPGTQPTSAPAMGEQEKAVIQVAGQFVKALMADDRKAAQSLMAAVPAPGSTQPSAESVQAFDRIWQRAAAIRGQYKGHERLLEQPHQPGVLGGNAAVTYPLPNSAENVLAVATMRQGDQWKVVDAAVTKLSNVRLTESVKIGQAEYCSGVVMAASTFTATATAPAMNSAEEVAVMGSVPRPGIYSWAKNKTVRQLLLSAGFKADAAKDERVYLVRKHTDKGTVEWLVDVKAILAGAAKDIDLQPGDLLVTEDIRQTIQTQTSRPATQAAGSKLEFRVAPRPSVLDKAELAMYTDRLKAGWVGLWWKNSSGEVAGTIPQYAWLPVWGELTNAPGLVTGEYDGQKYVLVSDKSEQMMVPGEGKNAWGLTKVYATTDGMNRPVVGFELDDRGAELFSALTKANINNALAIVVEDNVVSAPVIRTTLGKHGTITGRFTDQEVKALVQALKAGMPPVSQPATQPPTTASAATTGAATAPARQARESRP